MANPNIVNVTGIYGKTQGAALTTAFGNVVVNSAASNKVLKINSLYVSNIDGINNATCDVVFYDSSANFDYYLAEFVVVPAASTLKVITRDSFIYLEEGDLIKALANVNSDLQCVVSYEEIS